MAFQIHTGFCTRNKAGFTLAEVLITIAIIGVVAALTIPALIQNTTNDANITALKKSYLAISQATNIIKEDNNGRLTGVCNDAACWVNLYKAKLNFSKYCSPVSGCWQASLPDPFAAYAAVPAPAAGLVLADGTYVGFTHLAINCNNSADGLASCARIDIDVNGNKGTKTEASDLFSFHLTSSGLKPFGSGDSKPCRENDKSGCTATFVLGGIVGPPGPPEGAIPCYEYKACYNDSDGSYSGYPTNYPGYGYYCLSPYNSCVDSPW